MNRKYIYKNENCNAPISFSRQLRRRGQKEDLDRHVKPRGTVSIHTVQAFDLILALIQNRKQQKNCSKKQKIL